MRHAVAPGAEDMLGINNPLSTRRRAILMSPTPQTLSAVTQKNSMMGCQNPLDHGSSNCRFGGETDLLGHMSFVPPLGIIRPDLRR